MTAKELDELLQKSELVGKELSDKFQEGLRQIIQLNEIVGNKLQWQDFECKYHKGNVMVSKDKKEYGLVKLI